MDPDVHTWWPELSIDAKHRLREHPDAPLDEDLRAEIERITGEAVSADARLDEADARFIRTQREQVD